MTLTARQREVLVFVRKFIADHSYSPSIREIVDSTSISSTSVVNYTLDALEGMGYLTRQPSKTRTIVLTKETEPR